MTSASKERQTNIPYSSVARKATVELGCLAQEFHEGPAEDAAAPESADEN